MDIQLLRFLVIGTVIIVGMFLIPMVFFGLMIKKYKNRAPWWTGPVIILYIVLFFNFAPSIMPNNWKLIESKVYQCEWKTVYVSRDEVFK